MPRPTGLTNLGIHRTSAAVEMGEGALDVQAHEKIAPGSLAALPAERRANHLLDVARGYAQWGRPDQGFPAIGEAMRKLQDWGVSILAGDDVYRPHEPGTGNDYVHLFPWEIALREADARSRKHRPDAVT